MTNEQLTNAFVTALTEYQSVPFREIINQASVQFFFFAGAQFGTEATAAIYRETYGDTHVSEKMRMPDEIVGEPV